MKTKFLLIPLIVYGMFSFIQERTISEKLQGRWVKTSGGDKEEVTYSRRDTFRETVRGVEFKPSGEAVVHQQDFWCTTGGTSYGNLYGTWQMVSDSVVSFSYKNRSYIGSETWQIKQVNEKTIKAHILESKLERNREQ